MTTINIAYAATQDWFEYTIISISSVLFNSKESDKYHFFILSDNFSEENKNAFYKLNKIKNSEFSFLKIDNSEFGGIFISDLGYATNYRLKLSSLTNEDKILYLDSDTIVLDDISELYNTDIEDYYIAAVKDKSWKAMRWRISNDETFVFINAGVVLMNLKLFRKMNLEDKMINYLQNNASNSHTDQDAINAVCINKIKYLPLKYNIMVGGFWAVSYEEKEYDDAIKSPKIAHFVIKPWNDKYYSTPFSLDWVKYKERIEEIIKD